MYVYIAFFHTGLGTTPHTTRNVHAEKAHTHTHKHTHIHTVSLHNNKQISLPRFCYLMGYPIHTLRETLARERACRLYVPCMRL